MEENKKKKKGPLFWIASTSLFWLIFISLITLILFVLLASNRNIQIMALEKIQNQMGLETDSPLLKSEREESLEQELEEAKEDLKEVEIELKVEKEIRQELLKNCKSNSGDSL
ncbi:hypothetical protein GF362_00475 [Candidatus Dojkabacteria bacterium]|nr:hypothetical protein [Candidatus Dojkabacteria bacterium]